ncbi:MAG: hypothetical protein BGO43_13765 [Gammaproteobacteria bacterium 39-13]|nr:Holliday junction resolvase RuvX [Gammaproteobacteria bacterium]OJV88944.1 MAG: hypothetical protein BGO43_13765 [Gammaproteobacteria bacterium 39-13]
MNGTFFGFDFGTKRLGVAVGQSVTKTARPLVTLAMKNGTLPTELTAHINEWQPKALIVGLALQPDGSHSKTSLLAQKFGRRLAQAYQLPVFFIEERLTSVAAQERIRDTDSTSLYSRDVDAVAAAIILESWLNSDSKGEPT